VTLNVAARSNHLHNPLLEAAADTLHRQFTTGALTYRAASECTNAQ
jgi:hypothetical protein